MKAPRRRVSPYPRRSKSGGRKEGHNRDKQDQVIQTTNGRFVSCVSLCFPCYAQGAEIHEIFGKGKRFSERAHTSLILGLDAIPDVLKNLNAPVLMFGDFNATPWSFYFRKLVRDTSLVPGSAGRGLQPTWPSWFPPLLIPIDHCFGSQEVRFVSSKVGTHVGSDHYPLLFEFMLVPRQ